MRVLTLVGVFRDDFYDERYRQSTTPTVVGAIPEHVWEHETQDETDARWSNIRATYDPDGTAYEWREVWVTLDDAALRAHFDLPDVAGWVGPPAKDGWRGHTQAIAKLDSASKDGIVLKDRHRPDKGE